MAFKRQRANASALVIVVGLLVAFATGTKPASSFSLDAHEGIIRDALGSGNTMDPEAMRWVIGHFLGGGALGSDRYQLAAERHFDNASNPAKICELWDRGVNRFLSKAVELSAPVGPELRQLRNRRGALEAFGEAAHAIADFYSHTDWVEIYASQGKTANLPVAPLSGRSCAVSELPPALQSGYFSLSHGVDGCPSTTSGGPKPPEGFKYCHSQIAKDKPDSGHGREKIGDTGTTYHQAARSLAVASTRQAWDALRDRVVSTYGGAADGNCIATKLAMGGEASCQRR